MEFTCCATGKTVATKADSSRIPKGWKRLGESVYSPAGWQSLYVLRAVTLPIVGPLDGDWPEFREALAEQWGLMTNAANWMLSELYARDVRREPGMEKLPAMPKAYLYPEARAKFPAIPSRTISALEQAVQGKYRSKRYAVLWQASESLPNMRYPQPFIASNQSWKAGYDDEGRPFVDVPIGEKRWRLRLRGGAEFGRQLGQLKQIISGEAVQGELAIYRKSARVSDGRNGDTKQTRVMCKLVAWLPRRPAKARDGERFFSLSTDPVSFLYGVLEGREEPWVLHADHVREWSFAHRRWLDRQADDTKHERRIPRRRKARLLRDYSQHARKYRDRMNTFIQMTAAQVVSFAERNRVTRIKYSDACREYLEGFPWHEFKQRLECKADESGISFEHASGDVASKSLGSLANDVNEKVTT